MATKMPCPILVFLRRRRCMPPLRQLGLGGRRAFHISPKTLGSEERTFRGQLYESTARRIQAQREAEERFHNMKPLSAFASKSAFTFGMHPSVAEMSKADFCSGGFLVCPGLLHRKG